MSHQHGLARCFDGVQRGAIPQCETSTAMPKAFMRSTTSLRIRSDPVVRIDGAAADEIIVIRQLGDPLAQW